MIAGTTPTLTLRLVGKTVDLTQARNVYVTIRQGSSVITKTGEDLSVDGNVVSVWLNQRDTLNLRQNATAKVQVNWTYLDAYDGIKRSASKSKEITIDEQLLTRVIE